MISSLNLIFKKNFDEIIKKNKIKNNKIKSVFFIFINKIDIKLIDNIDLKEFSNLFNSVNILIKLLPTKINIMCK